MRLLLEVRREERTQLPAVVFHGEGVAELVPEARRERLQDARITEEEPAQTELQGEDDDRESQERAHERLAASADHRPESSVPSQRSERDVVPRSRAS